MANNARRDNRWGSLLSSMIFSNFNIYPAIDAQCRPNDAITGTLGKKIDRLVHITRF